MSDTNTTFGEWLRTARTEAGWSQQNVADAMRKAGHDTFRQTKVAKIEHGGMTVSRSDAVAIVSLFGTTLDVALRVKPNSAPSVNPAVQELAERTALLRQIRAQIDSELGGAS